MRNGRDLDSRALIVTLQRSFPGWISSLSIEADDQPLLIPSSNLNHNLYPLLYTLRNSSLFRFKSLNDLFGADLLNYPSYYTALKNNGSRYEVSYYLLSKSFENRLRVVKPLTSKASEVDSVTSLFSSANWLEREVWDLYGVHFFNHPDLRRILTDYGFMGFPLRKEFPLTGYVEVRYSEKRKRIVLKPVALAQEFRRFEFTTPWDRFYLR